MKKIYGFVASFFSCELFRTEVLFFFPVCTCNTVADFIPPILKRLFSQLAGISCKKVFSILPVKVFAHLSTAACLRCGREWIFPLKLLAAVRRRSCFHQDSGGQDLANKPKHRPDIG